MRKDGVLIEQTNGWWVISALVRYKNSNHRDYVPGEFLLRLKTDSRGDARPFLREYMKENNLIFAE